MTSIGLPTQPDLFNWRLNPDDYKATIFDKKK